MNFAVQEISQKFEEFLEQQIEDLHAMISFNMQKTKFFAVEELSKIEDFLGICMIQFSQRTKTKHSKIHRIFDAEGNHSMQIFDLLLQKFFEFLRDFLNSKNVVFACIEIRDFNSFLRLRNFQFRKP